MVDEKVKKLRCYNRRFGVYKDENKIAKSADVENRKGF
jgi:hypothetical protein